MQSRSVHVGSGCLLAIFCCHCGGDGASGAEPFPSELACRPKPTACEAPDITVEDAAQLDEALSEVEAGGTILLEPGDYGGLRLRGLAFDDYVSLCGSDEGEAVFSGIQIDDSSYLRIHNVRVESEEAGSQASSILSIKQGSHHIEVASSEIHGTLDDDYSGHRIVDLEDVSDIVLRGNFLHSALRGLVMSQVTNTTIVENRFEDLGDDDIKFIGVDGLQIENNVGARRKYPSPEAHLDFIQGQGSASRNVVIRGNVTLPENKYAQQGIFLSDTEYHDVLIENNVVYVGLIRGINVSQGSNHTIRYNTVLDMPDEDATPASEIFASDDAVVENNISMGTTGTSGPDGSNLVIQNEDPDRRYYCDDYYEGASKGTGVTIEDLRPLAEAESLGAFARIGDLLSGRELPPCQ